MDERDDERDDSRAEQPGQDHLIKGVILELFGRHHNAIAAYIAGLLSELTAKLDHNHKETMQMSDTFHTDLAANTAATQSLVTEVTNGLATNAAAIQALKDQIAAGNPVTAADLATLEGNTASMQTAVTTLQSSLNPAPATPPATP